MKVFFSTLLMFFSYPVMACISASDETVKFSGVVAKQTFPGRPNYESVKNGDEPVKVWVLTTTAPHCFKGLKDPQNKFQLFWSKKSNTEHIQSAGNFTVKGITMEALSGHHFTPILIEIISTSMQ